MVQNYRGRDARLAAETSRIRIVTAARALSLSPDLQAGKRHIETLRWLSCDYWRCMPSRTTARVQNEFRLPTVRCREPATSYSTGTSAHCCVVSTVAFLLRPRSANATMNAVGPICIEPLQIERPGLSVAQAERIRWVLKSGVSLHGASSSGRSAPATPH